MDNEEYIKALYNIFQTIYLKAESKKDQRLKVISLCIFNYIKHFSLKHKISLQTDATVGAVNLAPIFAYIEENSIELYDFSTIKMEDVDMTNNADIERFVLSHVYCLTQK